MIIINVLLVAKGLTHIFYVSLCGGLKANIHAASQIIL